MNFSADELNYLLHRYGIKWSEFAEYTGISGSTLDNILNGETASPKFPTLDRIYLGAKHFEFSKSEMESLLGNNILTELFQFNPQQEKSDV